MPADGQQSIEHQLIYCENMVEDSLKDRLGASNSPQRNVKFSSIYFSQQITTDTTFIFQFSIF